MIRQPPERRNCHCSHSSQMEAWRLPVTLSHPATEDRPAQPTSAEGWSPKRHRTDREALAFPGRCLLSSLTSPGEVSITTLHRQGRWLVGVR
jgi:hypothetical protein